MRAERFYCVCPDPETGIQFEFQLASTTRKAAKEEALAKHRNVIRVFKRPIGRVQFWASFEMSELTKEEKRVKIAEACPRIQNDRLDARDHWIWQDTNGEWHECHENDPLADLNAMNAAEKELTDEEFKAFHIRLCAMSREQPGLADHPTGRPHLRGSMDETIRFVVSATAAHRAEALGITLGLWT